MSEWADEHRVLAGRGANEAGPWRTARTPYLREIMDRLSPKDPAQRVVFMKGAQVGGTEAGNNWLGYVIHHAPGPMMAVQPTVDMAKRFSQQRVDTLIEESPELSRRVSPARARDSGNTVLSKEFPGGIVVMTGANSAVGLRSMSARYLFLDEIDAYPPILDDEGDPIALAVARTRTFSYRRKILEISTPKLAGSSRIERDFLLTDQRRYFVACPHEGCGHYQHLEFARLRWEKGRPEGAAYHCASCERPIAESAKTRMLETGEWRPTAVASEPNAVGYHLSSLYSPLGWLSWAEIARMWEAAKRDEAALRTFVNTIEGRPWQERGEAPEWEMLYRRREAFAMRIVPAAACILTAGVDVQDDRLEFGLYAWNRRKESWVVEYRQLRGDTREAAVWDELADLLAADWPHENGMTLPIRAMCVDRGGHRAPMVDAFVARHPAPTQVPGGAQARRPRTVIATVGRDDWRARVLNVQNLDAKKRRRAVPVVTLGASYLKSEIVGWLKQPWPSDEDLVEDSAEMPVGAHHVSEEMGEEYCRQLCSEEIRDVRQGGVVRKRFVQLANVRNEALDIFALNRAAAHMVGIDHFTPAQWRGWEEMVALAAPEAAEQPAAPVAEVPLPQARPGWSPRVGRPGWGRR